MEQFIGNIFILYRMYPTKDSLVMKLFKILCIAYLWVANNILFQDFLT